MSIIRCPECGGAKRVLDDSRGAHWVPCGECSGEGVIDTKDMFDTFPGTHEYGDGGEDA
jgi:hypothetical protein